MSKNNTGFKYEAYLVAILADSVRRFEPSAKYTNTHCTGLSPFYYGKTARYNYYIVYPVRGKMSTIGLVIPLCRYESARFRS